MSVEQPDETTHAKPKTSDKRKGLLADRYRPGQLIEHDAIRTSHEGVDEADGSKVVVHFLGERFASSDAMRRDTVARLHDHVGRGNRFVSPLMDAGIARDRVFIVEPRSPGVTLRSVLRGRAKSRKPLTPEELLPVVARIRAAFEALPEEVVLGRISPRTVYIDAEGLRLSECFLLPCVDRKELVALLGEDESFRAAHAPECTRGLITRAIDVFAVGALVYEAIAFAPFGSDAAVSLGPLDSEVRALLSPSPAARPDLDVLVERLASLAGLRLPDLDAEPFDATPAERAARIAELVAFDDDVLEADDDDDDDVPVIREEDKTRQIAMPQSGPVIDDLAKDAGGGRLPAPAIDIEAAPTFTQKADAPKAPPPTRKSRPGGNRMDSSDTRLPAPPQSEPPPAPTESTKRSRTPLPAPRPLPKHDLPSVQISITPVPPRREDATERIRDVDRKRVGDTTLQLRAIDDYARGTMPTAQRAARAKGPRLVLIATIVSAVLLAAMLVLAYVRKRNEEAERRELIERRLQQITEE